MNTFLRPYNPKDFKNHTYITRQSILLLLAIPSTVTGILLATLRYVMNFSGPFFPTKVVVDQGFQSGQLRKTGFFILGLNYITLCNVGPSFYISKHFFA